MKTYAVLVHDKRTLENPIATELIGYLRNGRS